ncbi:MAG: glutamine--fructose-6-phosphate transaminase (isomerizing) [Desulfobacteraceae bacterium]|nr:glutamine--fructose-6-phosphate transaminase (isomerizing) [Desulfobacteraceae bacterium]
MCGIVGYISKYTNKNSLHLGIQALKRLEYRGYDSAGLAYWDEGIKNIVHQKAVGRIAKLEEKISDSKSHCANPVILHTRWATHGKVTEENAHPHCGCQQNIWVVHNGIIENHQPLRRQLEKEGHRFISETDTEVIAHLIEKLYKGNLEEAVRQGISYLEGTYGLAIICRDDPNKIVVARLSSPLLIGLGEDEYIIASDPAAVIAHTKKIIYLEDGEIASINRDNFMIFREKKPQEIEWSLDDYDKEDYPHFMLKEIMEQPECLENTLKGRLIVNEGTTKLGGLDTVQKQLRQVEKLYIVGCGTARHAGMVGEYMLEEYAGILSKVDAASEFRYRRSIVDSHSAVLAISQSGETADTLAAIREANARGILNIGITNVVGSTQARETDAGVYTRAGPETGVASTKAFTTQLATLALITLFLGRQRQLSYGIGQSIAKELAKIPGLARKTLEANAQIMELAQKYYDFDNFLYLGRKYNYPIAREGAHKIKETAYIHAEGCHGGEPKHCELALISKDFPSVCIIPNDSVYDKMISNIQEIKARKGPVIAIATEGNREIQDLVDDVIYIPETLEMLTPILSIIPLQLFAYHTAVLRGCEVDKPRNLAKSVTVE